MAYDTYLRVVVHEPLAHVDNHVAAPKHLYFTDEAV
jgi:hypothetical protein